MHEFERFAEVVIAGWMLFNLLGVVLVSIGLVRQYARLNVGRREEPAREVAFDSALPLTE